MNKELQQAILQIKSKTRSRDLTIYCSDRTWRRLREEPSAFEIENKDGTGPVGRYMGIDVWTLEETNPIFTEKGQVCISTIGFDNYSCYAEFKDLTRVKAIDED